MDLEKIKRKIEEFFESFYGQVKVELEEKEEKILRARIKAEGMEVSGETFFSIYHLLSAILKKQIKENFVFDFDLNDYRKKREAYLKELARSLADEVALTKKMKELEPMPAYERKIIHLELAERKDVVTRSIGEGEKRRVVIYPYP